MSTLEELAWQALALAKNRFTDAAVVISDKMPLLGKPPTEAELAEYRNETEALSRAHCEYAKAIQKEDGK
jgi:hypothetical protein